MCLIRQSLNFDKTLSGLTFFLVLMCVTTTVHAQSRHALVIGNSAYGDGFELINPRTDSIAIAEKLAVLGYEVHMGRAVENLQLQQLNDEIDNFLDGVQPGSSTLIYYAGHGAASSGNNYLIPILPDGVSLRSEADIRLQSVSLDGILERVQRRNPTGVNLFFFDACRDAPVESYSRSINLAGLERMERSSIPRGSVIGFSTDYGEIALDGRENDMHSPFAGAFLATLDTSAGLPVELFYKKVVGSVWETTQGKQLPIIETKIIGEHCIIECTKTTDIPIVQEFGTLNVLTTPANAQVCYQSSQWAEVDCDDNIRMPLNRDVTLTISADGYETVRQIARLTMPEQQLTVQLVRVGNNSKTWKIIGGVAAILAAGFLLSNDSGSSSSDNTTITLVRPGQ